MFEFITAADLAEFVPADMSAAKLDAMIADVMADARRVAPCLGTFEQLVPDPATRDDIAAQVRSILRASLARWAAAGDGAVQSITQTRGPFGETQAIDTRQQRRGSFWPSEIQALQDICRGISDTDNSARLWSIDQLGMTGTNHVVWCNLNMGGTWCSCGASLTAGRGPLWELP